MDFNDTKDEMNIVLGDTADTTFTPEEKIRALTKAWNDPYVVDDVWNTAGTFLSTTYQTAIPSGVSTVKDIGIKISYDDFPESIDASLWQIVDGNIHWSHEARWVLPDSSTLYILGTDKLTVADTLSTVALQEYVIALGAVNTLTLLGFKKANLFLKNDTSMGELIALKRDLQKDVENMRARFAKTFQDLG